jgi:hypothetical protein
LGFAGAPVSVEEVAFVEFALHIFNVAERHEEALDAVSDALLNIFGTDGSGEEPGRLKQLGSKPDYLLEDA